MTLRCVLLTLVTGVYASPVQLILYIIVEDEDALDPGPPVVPSYINSL